MLLTQQQHQILQAATNEQRVDLNINNTIAAFNTQIELFNNFASSTKVYNPTLALNGVSFYPVSVSTTPIVVKDESVVNGYSIGYFMGGIDSYVNANNADVVGNTKNYVFFDEFGKLVYQPGYVNGVATTGTVTVQSKQTNYRNIFDTMGGCAIYIKRIKVTVSAAYSDLQLAHDFKFVSSNIVASTGSNNQGTSSYQNEYANQANIVTMPINQAIDPNSGLWYQLEKYNGQDAMNVQLTVFFVPITKGML